MGYIQESKLLDQGSSLKLAGTIEQMAVYARSSVTLRGKTSSPCHDFFLWSWHSHLIPGILGM